MFRSGPPCPRNSSGPTHRTPGSDDSGRKGRPGTRLRLSLVCPAGPSSSVAAASVRGPRRANSSRPRRTRPVTRCRPAIRGAGTCLPPAPCWKARPTHCHSSHAEAGVPAMTMIQAPDMRLLDGDLVTYRLEEAGATLLALPGTGWSTRLRASSLEIVRAAIESYGWTEKRIRPPIPSAARITRMDEALGWITLIPIDRYVLRRIVGARSLVHPITERHLYPWRRLATAIGADHKAVQRWHAQGIDLIGTVLTDQAACRGVPALHRLVVGADRGGET